MKSIFRELKKIFNWFGLELSRKVTPNEKKDLWLTKLRIKTVIDIGANEGQFASFIKKIFPTSRVICFEPGRKPFANLQKIYGKDNTMILNNFALEEKPETKTMFKNSYSPSSSILPMADRHIQAFPHTSDISSESIEVKTLDEVFSSFKIEKPFMVKIDVQGYEKFVIDGGLDTIKQAKIIIIELSYKELYKNQSLFNEIYKILIDSGFTINGFLSQLEDPNDGEFLQCDAIFMNKNV